MQAGNLVSSDAMAFTSRVLVAGVQREIVSWSVNRELSGDLPAQVVAASGITQATGSIVFAGEDIEGTARNPWNKSTGWLPAEGDRVEIFAGDGVTEWKQFHGLIDKTTGDVGGGFQSTIIDEYDKLSAPFEHDALLRVMPSTSDGGARRGVGLSTAYYINAAMRDAGLFSTPPSEYDSALSVPAQGSMWPVLGYLDKASNYTGGLGSHLSNYPAPWGFSAGNFNLTFGPRTSYLATTPVQLTAMVAPEHSGNFFMTCYYGASDTLQLAVTGSRTAIVRVNGVEVCTLVLGSATIVTALYKGGTVYLRSNNGGSASGANTVGGTGLSTILMTGDENARVAGLQVSHPNTVSREFASLSWVPNAVPDYRSGPLLLLGLMDAGPAFEDTTCGEILERISKATLTPMWFDETGAFRVANSPWLRAKLPVKTVTTLDDVTSLDWESGLLSSRSRVTVEGDIPAINFGLWRNKVAYRGSGELKSGDTDEQFIGPDDDTDWIMLDDTLTMLGSSNWNVYNANLDSVAGVHYEQDGNPIAATGKTVTVSLEKLGLRQYKITHAAGTFPAGVTAQLATHPTSTDLYPRNRDKGLPRLNARAIVTWAKKKVTPSGVGGVGPELTHEAEMWVNRSNEPEILERIAKFIQSQTTKPLPTITGLSIVPDPRLQLGDRIAISSPDFMGVSLNALIVGVDSSFGGSYEQSLTVRVTGATSTFTTYAEFNKAGGALTYAQWQALGPVPETYAGFNTSAD